MSEFQTGSDSSRQSPSLKSMLSNPWAVIGQGFGSGLSPIMPGTVGTLFGWILFAIFTAAWPEIFTPVVWGVLVIIGFAVGIVACHLTGKMLGVPDHGSIVWDEIIAIWLVLLFVMPCGWKMQAIAFVLFRIFDMLKPPPIRYFDQHFKGGFGVMWDDIFAAFYTLLVIAIWRVIIP